MPDLKDITSRVMGIWEFWVKDFRDSGYLREKLTGYRHLGNIFRVTKHKNSIFKRIK